MKAIAASLLVLASVLAIHFALGARVPTDPPVSMRGTGFSLVTKWDSL
jgi:hypothetical protein